MNPDIDQLKSDIADLQSKWRSLTLSSGIPREVETAFKTRLGNTAQPFPVGAVYFNDTNVNPATELGYGTWSLISQGQMPVGYKSGDADFGTMAATGGEKTHTLTTNEMPAHSHKINAGNTGGALDSGAGTAGFNTGSSGTVNSVQSTGGGAAHNNLPPFYVLAIWKRTA